MLYSPVYDYPQASLLNPCFMENSTWLSPNISHIFPGISNHLECQALCSTSASCSSFTYFTQMNPHTPEECVLFLSTEDALPPPVRSVSVVHHAAPVAGSLSVWWMEGTCWLIFLV